MFLFWCFEIVKESIFKFKLYVDIDLEYFDLL